MAVFTLLMPSSSLKGIFKICENFQRPKHFMLFLGYSSALAVVQILLI